MHNCDRPLEVRNGLLHRHRSRFCQAIMHIMQYRPSATTGPAKDQDEPNSGHPVDGVVLPGVFDHREPDVVAWFGNVDRLVIHLH